MHNKFARSFAPGLPYKTIDKINHYIDNPTPMHTLFQNTYSQTVGDTYYNPYDVFGITNSKNKNAQHRRVNHDPVSAFMTGYMLAGEKGGLAAMAHLIPDAFDRDLRNKIGSKNADLFAALLEYSS